MLNKTLIIDAVRTPIGKLGGALSQIRADDLAALVIKELVGRNNSLDAELIDDVILGCANQAGEDNRNVSRMAALLSGLPFKVPGETVNRLCASGLSAVAQAAFRVTSGDGNLFISGGVEQMTRAPFVLAKAEAAFSRKADIYDTSLGWRFINPAMKELYGCDSMGETAENVARKFNISRYDQDQFALRSQQKAAMASEKGRFSAEITPVRIEGRKGQVTVVEHDEFPRPDTTYETLAALRPAFSKDGSVTAGNSSGLNDGACALLLASEEFAGQAGLKGRAKVLGAAVSGVEPRYMGIGPVSAVGKLLKKIDLKLEDFSVIELNEAFAAQSLACLRELGIGDDDPRVNPNGGAIALGHPLGMSGARLVQTAMHELELTGGRFALCTMCVGVGQGMALAIEKVS